jgi:hypothetical protein
MMITGIEEKGLIGPKGIASMELTVGSKTIPLHFSSQRYMVTTMLS